LRASGIRKEKCCSGSSKRRSGKIEQCLQVQGRGDGGGGQKVLQASPPLQVAFFADFACQSCFCFFLLILVLSLRHVMRVWFRSRERFLGLSVVVIIIVSNLVITDAEE